MSEDDDNDGFGAGEAGRLSQRLAEAVTSGDFTQARALLKAGADPNQPLPSWGARALTSLLGQAVKGGCVEMCEALIEAGADVEGKPNAHPPIYSANKADCLDLLLKAGARVDQRLSSGLMVGWTPLMAAASSGHVEIVDKLVAAGADMEASSFVGTILPERRGWTAAFVACSCGSVKGLEALLRLGCEVDGRDDLGRTLEQVVREGQIGAFTATAQADRARCVDMVGEERARCEALALAAGLGKESGKGLKKGAARI